MGRNKPAAWLAVCALAATALTGCASRKDNCDVAVNGNFGAAVTVDLNCPHVGGAMTSTVVREGQGNAVTQDQVVLLRATSFDSRTGKIIDSYDSGHIRLGELNSRNFGLLADEIVGMREGTRIVIKRPELVAGNKESAEIVVVDLLYTMVHGKLVESSATPPVGMPVVNVADGGGPSIVASGVAIPELAVVPIVEGNGSQVSQGDRIVAQYAVYDTNGTPIDATWNGSGPVALDLASTMQGLTDGLVDQSVGSRVVVLIPAAQAKGDGDRIVVVDILAILDRA